MLKNGTVVEDTYTGEHKVGKVTDFWVDDWERVTYTIRWDNSHISTIHLTEGIHFTVVDILLK